MSESVEVVDLFCGVGGLTKGLIDAGLKVNKGIDLDKDCQYAYEKNNNAKFIHKNISDLSEKEIKQLFDKKAKIKVLVGCAPCQTFSTHTTKYKYGENDKRWGLLKDFLKIIRSSNPEIVSMENVPNLMNKEIFNEFVNKLKEMKYNVSYQSIYCPKYKIPQKRRRLVLLASKLGDIDLLPPLLEEKDYLTVRDTIASIEKLESGKQSEKNILHKSAKLSEINLKRIVNSKQGGTWRDWDESLLLECHKKESGKTYSSVYGRMKWDEPSPTITTQFYNYGTGRFGHPEENRAISLLEGFLLQTFPFNYQFVDKQENIFITKIAKFIGNAVPPKLGEIIGLSIKKHLEELNYV